MAKFVDPYEPLFFYKRFVWVTTKKGERVQVEEKTPNFLYYFTLEDGSFDFPFRLACLDTDEIQLKCSIATVTRRNGELEKIIAFYRDKLDVTLLCKWYKEAHHAKPGDWLHPLGEEVESVKC